MRLRIDAVLRLSAIPGLGPARTRTLLRALADQGGELAFLPEYDSASLIEFGLDQNQIDAFFAAQPDRMLEQLDEHGIGLITMLDDDAPDSMKIGQAAPWYFTYGDPSMLRAQSIGFSGSRDASPEAIAATTQIASAAAARGWTVISGGARGIDSAAHMGAIEAGGGTVILVAQGIFGWKPSEEFSEANVLVLSEFLPNDDWGSYRAMQRNKSIIHLSDRLVIPQAGLKGGTMNAAEYALKVGHPTWVLDLGDDFPGNQLIARKGAQVLHWTGNPEALDTFHDHAKPVKESQLPLL